MLSSRKLYCLLQFYNVLSIIYGYILLLFQSLDSIADRPVMVNGGVRDQSAASEAEHMLDEVLYNLENGVEIALHRAQLWSKFAKDLVTFIDKRTRICELQFFL